MCVTESALILKNCGFEIVDVTFGGTEEVTCVLCGKGGKPSDGDNELSLALVSALVRECKFEKNGEVIEKVILKILLMLNILGLMLKLIIKCTRKFKFYIMKIKKHSLLN